MNLMKELLKDNYFRRPENIKPCIRLIDENHLVNGITHHIRCTDRSRETGLRYKVKSCDYYQTNTTDQAKITCWLLSEEHPIKEITLHIYLDRACTTMWLDYILKGSTDSNEFICKGGHELDLTSHPSKKIFKDFLIKNLEEISNNYRENAIFNKTRREIKEEARIRYDNHWYNGG